MQKWQYNWVIFYEAEGENVNTSWGGKKAKGYEQCDAVLGEIGELGWELTGVTSNLISGVWVQMQMVFKRPKT